MPDFLIGLMLVSTAGFLVGLGVHLRRLARGGNIGINQLILNEGRTIRSNGNCGPCQLNEELSPAAQAVRQAFTEISPAPADEIAVVALRAAVRQTRKRKVLKTLGATMAKSPVYCLEEDLLAIADELEAQ